MPATPFADTIDWDAYWAAWEEDGEEDYPAAVSGHHADLLERFIDRVAVPESAAFVGCGPGDLAAAVANAHPEFRIVGFDAAETVLARNRDTYADVPNLSFERTVLPAFDPDEAFGLVFCYATLHYVREIERALESLFGSVTPGGHLVFNYPSDAYRDAHRVAEGELRDRLQPVLEGANVLSRADLRALFDREVRDFWTAVGADGPFVRPENPCVFVEK